MRQTILAKGHARKRCSTDLASYAYRLNKVLVWDGNPPDTTRKTLIGVSPLVTDCFGAALLLRAAAWKNTPRYHYYPVDGVTLLPTAPLVSGPNHAPNPG
jgi:hypothetical protein